MSKIRRVVLTGVGVITPVGNNKELFWNSLVGGKSGVGPLTAFDPTAFNSHIAAEVKDFDPSLYMDTKDIKHMDRFVHFGVSAGLMACDDGNLDMSKEDPFRVGVVIGSGIGGLHSIEAQCYQYINKGASRISPFLIPRLIVNMAPGLLSIKIKARGPNTSVATACATGTHAISDALRIIQRNEADVMVAGGAEGCITPLGFGGFCALKAISTRNDAPQRASRPFDKDRDGFVMGEGAGIVVLEELEHARKRGAKIYCELTGYGMSADAHHITAPDPNAEGAAYCMKRALDDAGLKPKDIDYINAHGTSTQLNDKMETAAIKKVFGDHAKKVAISSIKSMTGHLLGAAGGVEAITCAMTIQEGIITPTINYETPDPDCDLDYVPNKARKAKVKIAISNSFGFGGHNATLALREFEG